MFTYIWYMKTSIVSQGYSLHVYTAFSYEECILQAVLRIRDVYPGSRIRLFSIPDPGSELFPSRIRIKEFKYFNPKKWFLSSRKYDLGCSSRIRILTFYPSRIPDPGVKKAPDPGSRIRNTDCRCGGKGYTPRPQG
jgi:hypothetical protein